MDVLSLSSSLDSSLLLLLRFSALPRLCLDSGSPWVRLWVDFGSWPCLALDPVYCRLFVRYLRSSRFSDLELLFKLKNPPSLYLAVGCDLYYPRSPISVQLTPLHLLRESDESDLVWRSGFDLHLHRICRQSKKWTEQEQKYRRSRSRTSPSSLGET